MMPRRDRSALTIPAVRSDNPKHAQFPCIDGALPFFPGFVYSREERGCFASPLGKLFSYNVFYSVKCEIRVPGVDKRLQVVQPMLQDTSHQSDPCSQDCVVLQQIPILPHQPLQVQ